jgi:hypothetical protein
MRETITSTTLLTEAQSRGINHLAALGFEQPEAAMLPDTTAHIRAADEMQLIYGGDILRGFALYRRCLWR